MIISIDEKGASDKLQHSFLINLQQNRNRRDHQVDRGGGDVRWTGLDVPALKFYSASQVGLITVEVREPLLSLIFSKR